jgi:hypothetical protein
MKSSSIHVRLTQDDKNRIMDKSIKARMNLSVYVISAALNKNIAVIDGLPELLLQIAKIGNNINQIARVANSNSNVSDENVTQVKAALKEIDNKLSKFIKGMN